MEWILNSLQIQLSPFWNCALGKIIQEVKLINQEGRKIIPDEVSRTTSGDHPSRPVKSARKGGLSDVQLEKLPKITGKDLSCGNDCAICLDVIENEELARLVPGCNHGFHLECLDLWLSRQPFCPVCRHKLQPELFSQDGSNSVLVLVEASSIVEVRTS
ncbi:PREDICTED: E3 ubiquitin-protein ligase ATL23-like [Nicotiana attenuata]|uniref:E3 ubiquitin-protein ligase ATL23-like n=1 Tax=Nicotiana attenuata TaxID=49451 RepID=UPI00090483A3|nr:PREDICTED: E3 ubiquitin-protein ligase ATL23-like [Nicotiana attenuata]